ncbi:MAG: hypothetical protein ABIG34_02030 [Candidatus Peregrinibacteria bacterium]
MRNHSEQELARAIFAVIAGTSTTPSERFVLDGAIKALREGSLERMRPVFVTSVLAEALPVLNETTHPANEVQQQHVSMLAQAIRKASAEAIR